MEQPVAARAAHSCDICNIWKITRPASYVGTWSDGKTLYVCTTDYRAGAGRNMKPIK
jgi:hypothetical protein